LVTNNQLNFVVNNTVMGGDPAFGIVKTLQINFTLGGTNQTQSFAENSTVHIGGSGQPLTIVQALTEIRFPSRHWRAAGAGRDHRTGAVFGNPGGEHSDRPQTRLLHF